MNIKTDKDAFLYVKEQLLKQGTRSVNDTDDCVYRGFPESVIEDVKDRSYDEFGEMNYDLFHELLLEVKVELKCAAGHLFDDKFYDPHFEGQTVLSGSDIEDAIKASNPEWDYDEDSSFEMIKMLQTLHDNRRPENWAKWFEDMEEYFTDEGKYIANTALKRDEMD